MVKSLGAAVGDDVEACEVSLDAYSGSGSRSGSARGLTSRWQRYRCCMPPPDDVHVDEHLALPMHPVAIGALPRRAGGRPHGRRGLTRRLGLVAYVAFGRDDEDIEALVGADDGIGFDLGAPFEGVLAVVDVETTGGSPTTSARRRSRRPSIRAVSAWASSSHRWTPDAASLH